MKSIWIYGKHSVTAAILNEKRHIDEVFATKKYYEEIKGCIEKSRRNLRVDIVDTNYIQKIIGKENAAQGVLLRSRPIQQPSLESALANNRHNNILILDGVEDPRNLGAIIRSAAAFAIGFIILPEHSSPEESSYMLKSAAGYFEVIPLVYVTNLVRAMKLLKKNGYWVFGLDPRASSTMDGVTDFDKIALLVGGEGSGIRPLVENECDVMIKILMDPMVESLNVSNAATIAMSELYKKSITNNS